MTEPDTKFIDRAIVVSLVAFVACLVMIPIAGYYEELDWQAFRDDPKNNCVYSGDYSEWPIRMHIEGGHGWTCDDKQVGHTTHWSFTAPPGLPANARWEPTLPNRIPRLPAKERQGWLYEPPSLVDQFRPS